MPGPEERLADRNLVDQATGGDREAFGALVRRHQDRVFNLAYQIVRNREDALDVAQEAFVKAFSSLSSFKGEASFTTWMHRIAVNLAIDTLRRRRRGDASVYDDRVAVAEEGESRVPAPDNPEAALESQQVRRLLTRGIEALPPTHRAVLILREVDGLSYDEIARAVGCSLGTVMSRLFYARRKLQKILRPHLNDLR